MKTKRCTTADRAPDPPPKWRRAGYFHRGSRAKGSYRGSLADPDSSGTPPGKEEHDVFQSVPDPPLPRRGAGYSPLGSRAKGHYRGGLAGTMEDSSSAEKNYSIGEGKRQVSARRDHDLVFQKKKRTTSL